MPPKVSKWKKAKELLKSQGADGSTDEVKKSEDNQRSELDNGQTSAKAKQAVSNVASKLKAAGSAVMQKTRELKKFGVAASDIKELMDETSGESGGNQAQNLKKLFLRRATFTQIRLVLAAERKEGRKSSKGDAFLNIGRKTSWDGRMTRMTLNHLFRLVLHGVKRILWEKRFIAIMQELAQQRRTRRNNKQAKELATDMRQSYIRDSLKSFTNAQLLERALKAGVTQDEIDDAMFAKNTKYALTYLIAAAEDRRHQFSIELRTELGSKDVALSTLVNRAISAGASLDDIKKAREDPCTARKALIDLIVSREIINPPLPPAEALRRELRGMSTRELTMRAAMSGVTDALIAKASDADDPRAALVELIVGVEVPEDRSEQSVDPDQALQTEKVSSMSAALAEMEKSGAGDPAVMNLIRGMNDKLGPLMEKLKALQARAEENLADLQGVTCSFEMGQDVINELLTVSEGAIVHMVGLLNTVDVGDEEDESAMAAQARRDRQAQRKAAMAAVSESIQEHGERVVNMMDAMSTAYHEEEDPMDLVTDLKNLLTKGKKTKKGKKGSTAKRPSTHQSHASSRSSSSLSKRSESTSSLSSWTPGGKAKSKKEEKLKKLWKAQTSRLAANRRESQSKAKTVAPAADDPVQISKDEAQNYAFAPGDRVYAIVEGLWHIATVLELLDDAMAKVHRDVDEEGTDLTISIEDLRKVDPSSRSATGDQGDVGPEPEEPEEPEAVEEPEEIEEPEPEKPRRRDKYAYLLDFDFDRSEGRFSSQFKTQVKDFRGKVVTCGKDFLFPGDRGWPEVKTPDSKSKSFRLSEFARLPANCMERKQVARSAAQMERKWHGAHMEPANGTEREWQGVDWQGWQFREGRECMPTRGRCNRSRSASPDRSRSPCSHSPTVELLHSSRLRRDPGNPSPTLELLHASYLRGDPGSPSPTGERQHSTREFLREAVDWPGDRRQSTREFLEDTVDLPVLPPRCASALAAPRCASSLASPRCGSSLASPQRAHTKPNETPRGSERSPSPSSPQTPQAAARMAIWGGQSLPRRGSEGHWSVEASTLMKRRLKPIVSPLGGAPQAHLRHPAWQSIEG